MLNFEYFKKAIVRISAVGHEKLGGQVTGHYEKKQTENKARELALQKKRSSLAKKNSTQKKLGKKENENEDEKLEDEENEEKSPKKEGGLNERGAKPAREKVIIPNPKEELLKNSTIMKGKFDDDILLNKKSVNINKLYEIDQRVTALGSLKSVKVDADRISTECDVSLISDKTIEALIAFIGLDPVEIDGDKQKLTMDLRLTLDKKLNDRRKSVQGAKPTRLLNSNLPTKAEQLEAFADAVSEEDEADEDEREDSDENKNKKEVNEKDDDAKDDDKKK
jgi:sRNA-binding protein